MDKKYDFEYKFKGEYITEIKLIEHPTLYIEGNSKISNKDINNKKD